jgi:hypothetical protein
MRMRIIMRADRKIGTLQRGVASAACTGCYATIVKTEFIPGRVGN